MLLQVVESMDIDAVQTHIPLQRSTSQTILKKVNQQTLIISVGRHSSYIHHKMSTRTSIALVILKFRDFKLRRYLDIRDCDTVVEPTIILVYVFCLQKRKRERQMILYKREGLILLEEIISATSRLLR